MLLLSHLASKFCGIILLCWEVMQVFVVGHAPFWLNAPALVSLGQLSLTRSHVCDFSPEACLLLREQRQRLGLCFFVYFFSVGQRGAWLDSFLPNLFSVCNADVKISQCLNRPVLLHI